MSAASGEKRRATTTLHSTSPGDRSPAPRRRDCWPTSVVGVASREKTSEPCRSATSRASSTCVRRWPRSSRRRSSDPIPATHGCASRASWRGALDPVVDRAPRVLADPAPVAAQVLGRTVGVAAPVNRAPEGGRAAVRNDPPRPRTSRGGTDLHRDPETVSSPWAAPSRGVGAGRSAATPEDRGHRCGDHSADAVGRRLDDGRGARDSPDRRVGSCRGGA